LANLKVFRLSGSDIRKAVASEIFGTPLRLEREIHLLFENNMDVLLGARFLAHEYPTGTKHPGRIDSLAIDENVSPLIVEYKLHLNQNVINQGLYYLDWLLDHNADFENLARPKLRAEEEVDWSEPRVLCIAEDFTRYDIYAVEQIGRNIELVRYKLYADLVVLELVNTPVNARSTSQPRAVHTNEIADGIDEAIRALGDDVKRKELKHYVAYQRIRNFACVLSYKSHVLIYLRLDPKDVDLQPGFTKDMTDVGHLGTGNLEVRLTSVDQIDLAMALVRRSYESA
jgi:predicted transport protein